jgi:hypothetical protein
MIRGVGVDKLKRQALKPRKNASKDTERRFVIPENASTSDVWQVIMTAALRLLRLRHVSEPRSRDLAQ